MANPETTTMPTGLGQGAAIRPGQGMNTPIPPDQATDASCKAVLSDPRRVVPTTGLKAGDADTELRRSESGQLSFVKFNSNGQDYYYCATGTGLGNALVGAHVRDARGNRVEGVPPVFKTTTEKAVIDVLGLTPNGTPEAGQPQTYSRGGYAGTYTIAIEKGEAVVYYSGGKHVSGADCPPQAMRGLVWNQDPASARPAAPAPAASPAPQPAAPAAAAASAPAPAAAPRSFPAQRALEAVNLSPAERQTLNAFLSDPRTEQARQKAIDLYNDAIARGDRAAEQKAQFTLEKISIAAVNQVLKTSGAATKFPENELEQLSADRAGEVYEKFDDTRGSDGKPVRWGGVKPSDLADKVTDLLRSKPRA